MEEEGQQIHECGIQLARRYVAMVRRDSRCPGPSVLVTLHTYTRASASIMLGGLLCVALLRAVRDEVRLRPKLHAAGSQRPSHGIRRTCFEDLC